VHDFSANYEKLVDEAMFFISLFLALKVSHIWYIIFEHIKIASDVQLDLYKTQFIYASHSGHKTLTILAPSFLIHENEVLF
jgi:hypothetical protein